VHISYTEFGLWFTTTEIGMKIWQY